MCTVVIGEQISGWQRRARPARTPADRQNAAMLLAALVVSWHDFTIIPETAAAAARYDALRKAKLNVGGYDLQIAAVAPELGATVVTRNRRDFGRVPGVLVGDGSA